MLAAGTMDGSEQKPVSVKSSAAVSSSPMVNEREAVGVSSKMVWGPRAEMTGLRLICLTVRRNEFVLDAPSGSRATMLTVTFPYLAGRGVMLRKRLGPVPDNSRFALGNST